MSTNPAAGATAAPATPAETPAVTPETAAPVAATTEVAVEPTPVNYPKPTNKDELYRQLAGRMNSRVEAVRGPGRKVFGDQHGHDFLEYVLEGLLTVLVTPEEDGTYKPHTLGIPGGLGSFGLDVAKATTKRTPRGDMIDVPARWRFLWRGGKYHDDLLKSLPAPPASAQSTEDTEEASAEAPAAPASA